MDVPVPYLINDTRKIDFFKKTTFSNFLKKDVFDALFKKIDEGKIADVCFWTAECIVSGYQDELWDRVINYYARYINISVFSCANFSEFFGINRFLIISIRFFSLVFYFRIYFVRFVIIL